jgi:Domain of unknown function (DUF4145)
MHRWGEVFDQPLQISSSGGLMKCPTCGEHTPDSWQNLQPPALGARGNHTIGLGYMQCANNKCGELVVRVHDSYRVPDGIRGSRPHADAWLAYPGRGEARPIDPLVPDEFKRDYQEAAAILDISPRMAAVLARSILADLLEKYVKLTDFSLSKRIDKFRADKTRPSNLRENIHHFREIADFGAHTQKNDQDQIIPVDRDGAEWMLDFLDRLFTYFIVEPEKDREMRERWDKNLADAGREPINPLPDGPPSEDA